MLNFKLRTHLSGHRKDGIGEIVVRIRVLSADQYQYLMYRKIGDTSDPLQIKSIEVFPDPPKPGQDMTVKVKAYAQELIEVCIRHFLSQN